MYRFSTRKARFCQCKIPGFRCFFRKKSIDERALSSPRGTSWGGRGGGGGSTGQLPRRYPPNLSAKAGRYHPQTRGVPRPVGGGTTASRNRFHRLLDTIFSRRVVARVRRHAGDYRATDLEGTPRFRAQRPTSCRPTCAAPVTSKGGTPLGHPFDELQLKKRLCVIKSVPFSAKNRAPRFDFGRHVFAREWRSRVTWHRPSMPTVSHFHARVWGSP